MAPIPETSDANIAFMAAYASLGYKRTHHTLTHPERACKSKPKPYDRPESSQHALHRMQQSELLREASAGGRVGRTIYNQNASTQIKVEALAEAARIVEEEDELDRAGELYLADRSAQLGALKIKTEWSEPTLALVTMPRTPQKRSDALAATPQLSPAGSSRLSSPASSILSTPGPGSSLFDAADGYEDDVLPSPLEPVTVVKIEDEISQDAARLFAEMYTNEDSVFM
ncbi:hypothetical protein PENSPDRAFT_680943 [Peniophora sp. CONT]|nr:hypothetical protein PENSPDRAFT_680943 [Peniophora sp. CONT]